MSYIYHGVPQNMEGSELMPLNDLKAHRPRLYNLNIAKYDGRKDIMERRIPLLNCLWNDVVQFLPLHPKKVFQLQAELNLIPTVPPYKFFEFDLSLFDPKKAVVFFKSAPGEENSEVKWLSDVNIATIQDIPPATVNYYKSLIGTGELPFNYQFIPHIMYMGKINVTQAKIITL